MKNQIKCHVECYIRELVEEEKENHDQGMKYITLSKSFKEIKIVVDKRKEQNLMKNIQQEQMSIRNFNKNKRMTQKGRNKLEEHSFQTFDYNKAYK